MIVACHTSPDAKTAPKRHQANVSMKGASLYIDRINCRPAADSTSTSPKILVSFLVGVTDSSKSPERHGAITRELYMQYKMDKDWVAVVNGDSIRSVYAQHHPGPDTQKEEEVLVFEVPAGQQPDTLVYTDSFGSWGTQIVVLD